jgi:two-component system response regulator AtoC
MNAIAKKRILIVDDEEPVRTICVRTLAPLGHSLAVAADADEALAYCEKEIFDLVITDYRMPGTMDGLVLGQTIKRRSPETQIILMTAFPAVDTAVGTLRMGALDYLVKPFDQKELIDCVNDCFLKQSAA